MSTLGNKIYVAKRCQKVQNKYIKKLKKIKTKRSIALGKWVLTHNPMQIKVEIR